MKNNIYNKRLGQEDNTVGYIFVEETLYIHVLSTTAAGKCGH